MSTIKSSDEHLTLNADGSSKDIKFQANGVEKASISSAGAFTSTTIDATKLTGNLPAISGANLTGVGVAGISSSADATAITIDSSEKVGIGTTSPTQQLHSYNTSAHRLRVANANYGIDLHQPAGASSPHINAYGSDVSIIFDVNDSEKMRITADGRGKSQFTAKAWARIDMEAGTMAITDSHNISSVTDRGEGKGRVTFANNFANANYTVAGNALDGGGENDIRVFNHSNETRWRVNDFDWYTTDQTAGANDAINATMIFFGD